MNRLLPLGLLLVPALIPAMTAQAPPLAGRDAPPEPAAQDRLLEAMERYGAQYVSGLPNFLCVQVTRQFEAGMHSDRWRKGDTLTSRLSFHDGQEKRTLELVNGKPADPAKRQWHTPLVTEGEFGILISRVVDPASDATFTWSRWESVRGKRLAVFDYSVDKEHSTLTMQLSDLAKGVLAYRGSVYVDAETGAVWRITDTADSGIPPQLRLRQISTVVDYAETPIGGKPYLLPCAATVAVITDTGRVRNELEFQGYRKFEAESVITFGDSHE
jgi:hypothetical protein